jgi:hypothetical protein
MASQPTSGLIISKQLLSVLGLSHLPFISLQMTPYRRHGIWGAVCGFIYQLAATTAGWLELQRLAGLSVMSRQQLHRQIEDLIKLGTDFLVRLSVSSAVLGYT